MKKSPLSAFLLAPLAVPVVLAVSAAFRADDPARKDTPDSIMSWAITFGAVTLFAYAATAFLGVPLIRLLRRLDRLSVWWVLPSAALLGAVALAAVLFGTGGYIAGPIWSPVTKLIGEGALLGLPVGASYCWLAGIRGRREEHTERLD